MVRNSAVMISIVVILSSWYVSMLSHMTGGRNLSGVRACLSGGCECARSSANAIDNDDAMCNARAREMNTE